MSYPNFLPPNGVRLSLMHIMDSQLVGGVQVSHELHNTMPLNAVITWVQRNLLGVQRGLLGVQSHKLHITSTPRCKMQFD